jgi:hydroxyethylthiazole kinase-like uncharacterized protein yjeF
VLPVVTPTEMRAIDAAAPEPVEVLVDRAGGAVARAALRVLGGAYGRTVVVLAGPGNNGADGRVAAERLRRRGVAVTVFDALDLPAALPAADLVIDAAFGTGFRGSWRPPDVGGARVLAVDVPTGLDALTGHAPAGVLRADATITFAAAKPGHVLGAGPDLVGELQVADIGLDVGGARIGIVERSDVAAWLPDRPRDAHKWRSALRVVAGSVGMTGAASLVAAAGQRAGAGMVVLSSPGIDPGGPVEAVGRRLPVVDWDAAVLDDLDRFEALVIGPGLGRADHTVPSVVRTVTGSVVPTVVDGDGLFAMSWNEAGTPAFLRDREVATVLTPHDGEYALLTGAAPGRDRIAAARQLVELAGCVVLLKGPTTVVAGPDGQVYLVANGDQRLATAGTGDVLAGIVGALLACGVDAGRAAAAGAWLHAEAANALPERGLVAGDLVAVLPEVLAACR